MVLGRNAIWDLGAKPWMKTWVLLISPQRTQYPASTSEVSKTGAAIPFGRSERTQSCGLGGLIAKFSLVF